MNSCPFGNYDLLYSPGVRAESLQHREYSEDHAGSRTLPSLPRPVVLRRFSVLVISVSFISLMRPVAFHIVSLIKREYLVNCSKLVVTSALSTVTPNFTRRTPRESFLIEHGQNFSRIFRFAT